MLRDAKGYDQIVMEEDKELQILDENKADDRGLYLKRSQSAEVDVYEGTDPEERKKAFSQLIKDIGWFSTGGDSVEEIKRERQR